MTDISSEPKKVSFLKKIAILGLIGIITWASIGLVSVAPAAFTSLASLASSLNDYKNNLDNNNDELDTLIVTSNKTIVPTSETFELSWSTVRKQGSYTFSYKCTDGVALDIVEADGNRGINCEQVYNIGNISTLKLKADSEKNRFSEIKYTIAFLGTNDTKPRASGEASLTIINSKISDSTVAKTDDSKDSSNVGTATTTETSKPQTVTTPVAPTTTTKPAPTYTQEYVYTIPVSDPKGRVDLAARFINSGRIVGNTFFPEVIKQNDKGAIQFEVKNYGTKTSGTWTFSVTLPNGELYTSSNQTQLKPNERAVLTIGFATTNTSNHKFTVKVIEKSDRTTLNNQFTQSVSFLK